jgi:hypothetical protein
MTNSHLFQVRTEILQRILGVYIHVCTEGSTKYIVTSLAARGRCAQHLRRIRGCDARIGGESSASHKYYAQNSRMMCVM